jgi:hypothetical protein
MAEVRALVERAVAEVGERNPDLHVDDLVVLDAPLDEIEGALTPTGKARRDVVIAAVAGRTVTHGSSGSQPQGSGAPA